MTSPAYITLKADRLASDIYEYVRSQKRQWNRILTLLDQHHENGLQLRWDYEKARIDRQLTLVIKGDGTIVDYIDLETGELHIKNPNHILEYPHKIDVLNASSKLIDLMTLNS